MGSYERNLEKILKGWKFPLSIIEKYKEKLGIEEIFEWQAECLNCDKQIQNGSKNLVYSAPTSAGKTLVAELLMLKNVLETRKKAIVIFPYVSLSKEKLKHLQLTVLGNTSPNGGFSTVDIAICTIEKANTLLNRLIDEETLYELSTIVVDELHMVNDKSRGYLIELILSKIMYLCKEKLNNKIQIIGMSATLPNLNVLAEWLNATLYQTDFRPISLLECLKYEKKLIDKDQRVVSEINIDKRIENDPDLLAHLVLETIVNKLGVLVFCPTKSRCEVLAENIARVLYNLDRNQQEKFAFLNKEKIIECLNELKNTPAGLDAQLGKTIRYGIAFHHAGLTTEEREIVETYFKNGHLLVIVCTSTLSSGINFPARRVIIRTPIFNGKPIDIMNYKQMVGRAGRKGIDTMGESIIMCANANEKLVAEHLLNAKMQEVKVLSKQPATVTNKNDDLMPSIKRALLETIVSAIATKKKQVIDYVNCFLSNRSDDNLLYEKHLKWLQHNQFIDIIKQPIENDENNQDEEDECYKPTQLGYAVVASAMSPDEGLVIFGELQKAMQCFVLENELHIIYQITPINICDYWTNSSANVDWNLYFTLLQNFSADIRRVADLVGVRQSFILKMIKGNSVSTQSDQKLLKIHLRFFTSLILNDLVNEVSFNAILNKFGCQKGFLQTLQQQSSTYASMITVFCNRLGWYNLELLLNQFQSRLIFGVQRQLLDLIRIKLLNAHRARLFYNAGYTNVSSIAMCELRKVEKILRSSIQFAGAKRTEHESEPNCNGEQVIWCDGVGYTYWQAAECILKEANELLRVDLENMGVKLNPKSVQSNLNKSANHKSVFEFNETIESIIQSQPINKSVSMVLNETVAKQVDCELSVNKPNEDKNDEVVENSPEKEESLIEIGNTSPKEPVHSSESPSSNSSNENSIKTLADLVSLKTPTTSTCKQNENEPNSDSLIDDQCMLEAAACFEKNINLVDECSNKKPAVQTCQFKRPQQNELERSESSKKVLLPRNDINSTILSQDVLDMCNIMEKNALSSSKKFVKKPENKENYFDMANTTKKKLDFSFGEHTLNELLNTQTQFQDLARIKQPQGELEKSINQLNLNDKEEREEEVEKQLEEENLNKLKRFAQCSRIEVNLVETSKEYDSFLSRIKAKCLMSFALACESIDAESFNSNKSSYFEQFDQDLHIYVRFYGLFVCLLDAEKQTTAHFLSFRKDKVFLNHLEKLLDRNDTTKIMFYQKQHLKLFHKFFNISVKSPCYDPIIANYLLNQEVANIYQIKQKFCPNLNLNVDMSLRQLKSCFGCLLNTRQKFEFAATCLERGFCELLIGLHCFEKIKLQLQLQNLWIFFAKIESEIVQIVARCELVGFGLNSNELEHCKSILLKRKREIEEKVQQIAGREVNLNSSDEVAFVIYDKLKLTVPISNENMRPGDKLRHHKTSKDILQQLTSQHELPGLIIIWRKIAHTLSNAIYPVDRAKVLCESMHRIFPSIDLFNVTGRMTFNEPCLQHIPRDFDLCADSEQSEANQIESKIASSDESHEEEYLFFMDKMLDKNESVKLSKSAISIRNSFVPKAKCVFLSADYCQLELRIITNLCKDELLITIFNDSKHDVFNLLASKWLNVPVSEIDEEKRQNVKKIIYGILYGISPKTLSLILNSTETEACNFIESFKTKFCGLKKFINGQIENCKLKGYVETIRKRRRYLPNISSADLKTRAQAERQAINTIIQGSASDLVKSAMVKIEKILNKKYSTKTRGANLVLQMHDELIYEVDECDLNDVKTIMKDCMENCMELPVKMKVKLKWGKSWGQMETN